MILFTIWSVLNLKSVHNLSLPDWKKTFNVMWFCSQSDQSSIIWNNQSTIWVYLIERRLQCDSVHNLLKSLLELLVALLMLYWKDCWSCWPCWCCTGKTVGTVGGWPCCTGKDCWPCCTGKDCWSCWWPCCTGKDCWSCWWPCWCCTGKTVGTVGGWPCWSCWPCCTENTDDVLENCGAAGLAVLERL